MTNRYLAGIAHQDAEAECDETINSDKYHDVRIMVYGRNFSCNPRKENYKYCKEGYGEFGNP
jgi:hypothetical protein